MPLRLLYSSFITGNLRSVNKGSNSIYAWFSILVHTKCAQLWIAIINICIHIPWVKSKSSNGCLQILHNTFVRLYWDIIRKFKENSDKHRCASITLQLLQQQPILIKRTTTFVTKVFFYSRYLPSDNIWRILCWNHVYSHLYAKRPLIFIDGKRHFAWPIA